MSVGVIGEAPPTAGLPPRYRDLVSGSGGASFEDIVVARTGLAGAVVVPSGAAGLQIALELLRERQPLRGTVIVPAYTCPLVVIAIAAAGMRAVACDLVPGGFDLDEGHLARLIGPDTLAVIPTHYGGWIGDAAAVRQVVSACDREVLIIEDAAQAFGATLNGKSAGSFGDLAFYSFAVGKGLTLFEGGALVAPSDALIDDLRARVAARLKSDPKLERFRCLQLIGYHMLYTPGGLRLMFGRDKRRALKRGDDLAAALDIFPESIALNEVGPWRQRVGAAAASRLDAHLAGCRERARWLKDEVARIPGLSVFRQQDVQACDTQVFVRCASPAMAEAILAEMWPSRFGAGKLFARVITDYPYLAGKLVPSQTPNGREFVGRLVTLTTSPLMPDRVACQMVARLRSAAGQASPR